MSAAKPQRPWNGVSSLTRRLSCVLAVAACASPSKPPETVPARARHEGITVYDPAGRARACAPPERACPPPEPQADFDEACRSAGFRLQRCGCDVLCTGRVERAYFDATGARQPCAKASDDCEPPPPSAAFQDACTERGFRLQACGCDAWLCSGDPTK